MCVSMNAHIRKREKLCGAIDSSAMGHRDDNDNAVYIHYYYYILYVHVREVQEQWPVVRCLSVLNNIIYNSVSMMHTQADIGISLWP